MRNTYSRVNVKKGKISISEIAAADMIAVPDLVPSNSQYYIYPTALRRNIRQGPFSPPCPYGLNFKDSTCFCEDHCSFDICRLEIPPDYCLAGINGWWAWNSIQMYWMAQSASWKSNFLMA